MIEHFYYWGMKEQMFIYIKVAKPQNKKFGHILPMLRLTCFT